jgi:hypothetical protein
MDTLERLKNEFENQKIRYLEDKENKKLKIQEVENELKDHTQYLDDLLKQNQMDNNKAKSEYDSNISELEEINKRRSQIDNEMTKMEEQKIKWRNDFLKYNNHCDFLDKQENDIKLNTLKEIQELYKTRNNAEFELNNNKLFA